MKNFSVPVLIILVALFTSASAQAQKTAVQKTDVKSESAAHQPSPPENTMAAPAETNAPSQNDALITDAPVLNDVIISIKEERQYMEQKKKEQEKKNNTNKTDTPK